MKTLLLTLLLAAATTAFGQTTNRFAATIFSAKASDQSITNTTNMTDVTDLSFVTQANQKYSVTLLPILEATGGNFAVQMVASNATVYGTWNGITSSFGSATPATNSFTFGTITTARTALQQFYVVAGTNAGSVKLQFTQSAASTNVHTLKAGSFIRADKVPQ